jgi:hypothetical protein
VQMPAAKLIQLTLGQAFGLVAAHQRRHLRPARSGKSPAFPNEPRYQFGGPPTGYCSTSRIEPVTRALSSLAK